MRESEPRFTAAGVAVRCIVIGDQAKADEFCARHNTGAVCIGDPDSATYHAMGFSQFDVTQFETHEPYKARRAENEAAGFRTDWDATNMVDAAQNSGAAFIDAGGTIRWLRRAEFPGDMPPVDAIAAAVL